MRVGPVVHGALLVAALGFAYQTWTRDKSEAPKVGTVTVWNESIDDFEAFAYDGEGKSVRVERREEAGKSYYWGQVTRTEKAKKPRVPVKSPSSSEGGAAAGGHGAHGAGTPPAKGSTKAPAGGPAGASDKPAPGKAPPPATTSPHHARTDQPDKPAPAAKPASSPAPAAKPASSPAPAAKPADNKAGATTAKPAGQSAAGGSSTAAEEDDEDEEESTADLGAGPDIGTSKSKEFPIGNSGEELIANLAHLHAMRDLGVLTDQQKEDYELVDSKENLTVFFKNGKQHTLIIGARVFGSADRYVLHSESGKGYVLSSTEIMRHIDGAENSLGLKVLHSFQEEPDLSANPADPKASPPKRDKYPGVARIEIETPSGSRTVVRYEQSDKGTGGTILGWADKNKPGQADVTFANFLSQIERLRPVEYDPSLEVSSLTKLMTLRYFKEGGDSMGTFELYRREPSVTPELEPSGESKKGDLSEYYVKTELTRVPGKVGRMMAERVTEDVPQLFGAPPKKKENAKESARSQPAAAPAPAPAAGKSPADNPAAATPDKPKAKPGQPVSPPSNPTGSNPNPNQGNK